MAAHLLDHIGIAVHSLTEGAAFWQALGLDLEGTETVPEQQVRVGFLPAGQPRIELLEPTSPDSPIAGFLKKRGPGLHHICLQVDDIRAVMAALAEQGYRLLSEQPTPGAHGALVCFVHPRSTGGVLLELSQPVAEHD